MDRECRYLAARGYRVTLIAPHARDEMIDNVHIRAVPRPSSRTERMSHVVREVYRRAVEEDADLYHFHDPELIPAALLLRGRKKEVIYDVHEDYPSTIRHSPWLPRRVRAAASWGFRHLERYASKRFSALIGANSQITERISPFNRLVIAVGNYPAFKDYPFTPRFDEARYAAGALVSFGGINPRTCTQAIVQALGLVPTSVNANLLLGGRVSSEPLFDAVRRVPGWGRVTYARELPVTMMLEKLLTASIGLVLFSPEPNHFGVGSNRFFEALAAGLPVITSNFPNWKELVNGIGCGIAVPPTDPRAIVEAVLYLLSHPAKAAEMGRRGYEMAMKQFNWELESCKLDRLYRQLLENK